MPALRLVMLRRLNVQFQFADQLVGKAGWFWQTILGCAGEGHFNSVF